jgi:hypothetical protein
MPMSVSRRSILLAGATLPLSALLTHGQTPGATGQTPGTTGQAPPPPPPGEDPLLAACVLIGGRKQIENCSYIKAKLTSDDAKKFAQAEIDEHEKNKADLKKLGYEYPVMPVSARPNDPKPAEPAKPEERKDGDPPKPVIVTAGKSVLPPEAIALVAVDHEVADQCILNYRKEMDKLSGLKLDKRFVGHQLDEHMALKDKVETFRRHASRDMKPVLDEGLKVIDTHIATLKALMEKLDGARDEKKGEK